MSEEIRPHWNGSGGSQGRTEERHQQAAGHLSRVGYGRFGQLAAFFLSTVLGGQLLLILGMGQVMN